MKLNQLLNKEWSQNEIKTYFDSLPPVMIEEMHGLWLGNEINTPHPMTGLLKKAGWYGKYFTSKDDVTPIVMMDKQELFAADPGLLSIKAPLNLIKKLPSSVLKHAVSMMRPVFQTYSSKARLRLMNYNGTMTTVMIYDQKPLIDVFKKIDDNTLLGRVEETVIHQHLTHYFVLSRDSGDWHPYQ